MIPTILGLDHVVIAVRDLDAAAAEWAALGFRLSPRGTHSEHMGSGNYTMMFGEDYLELLGVLAEKPHNAPLRGFLAKREGLERTAWARGLPGSVKMANTWGPAQSTSRSSWARPPG
jgi:catechol 2,3-dioxygenase-like lactoylglutathione lyase family enzyme